MPLFLALAVLVSGTVNAAEVQPARSAAAVDELARELSSRGLTAVAAPDPDQPGVYVAASYLPGVHLLAISGRSTSPAYVDLLLAEGRYDEVYASLNGGSAAEGRLFVQDVRADGLRPERDDSGAFDLAYLNVTKTVTFDGDWKKQGLTGSAYRRRFDEVERRYAQVVALLLARLRARG